MRKIILLLLAVVALSACSTKSVEVNFETPEFILSGTNYTTGFLMPMESENDLISVKQLLGLYPKNMDLSTEIIHWSEYENVFPDDSSKQRFLDEQKLFNPWLEFSNLNKYYVIKINAEPMFFAQPVDSVSISSYKARIRVNVIASELRDSKQTSNFTSLRVFYILSQYRDIEPTYGYFKEDITNDQIVEAFKAFEENEFMELKKTRLFSDIQKIHKLFK